MRIKFVLLILILLLIMIRYAESTGDYTALEKGDVLVYKEQLEDQGLLTGERVFEAPKDGYVEIYEINDENLGGRVKVGRMIWERSEKLLSEENGLRYGFPLSVGLKWDEFDSKRNDKMYCWYVEKIEDITVQAGTFKDCFKIVYDTCPDTTTEWYYPGVGIVKYEYRHHGTITNITTELIKIIKES